MNIGIDIDDTTVDLLQPLVKYGDIYNKEVLGREKIRKSYGEIYTRFYINELFDWDEKTKFDFFNMYYKNVIEESKLLPNANTTISNLKKEGNSIYFISARLLDIPGCNTKQITENTFKKGNVEYDELIMGIKDKLKVCKEKNIDIFIDDSYDICLELQQNGIKAYLMTTKINEKINNGQIERVYNWYDILEKIKRLTIE